MHLPCTLLIYLYLHPIFCTGIWARLRAWQDEEGQFVRASLEWWQPPSSLNQTERSGKNLVYQVRSCLNKKFPCLWSLVKTDFKTTFCDWFALSVPRLLLEKHRAKNILVDPVQKRLVILLMLTKCDSQSPRRRSRIFRPNGWRQMDFGQKNRPPINYLKKK